MKLVKTLACVLAVASGTICLCQAEIAPETAAEIEKQARVLADAFRSGEYAQIVAVMPDEMIEAMGGVDGALALIRNGIEQLSAQGFTISQYSLNPPADLYQSDEFEVAYVPTLMVLEGQASRVESTGYLVATRKKGSGAWRFMDGAGISDPTVLAQLFPGLPGDAIPPEKKNDIITK